KATWSCWKSKIKVTSRTHCTVGYCEGHPRTDGKTGALVEPRALDRFSHYHSRTISITWTDSAWVAGSTGAVIGGEAVDADIRKTLRGDESTKSGSNRIQIHRVGLDIDHYSPHWGRILDEDSDRECRADTDWADTRRGGATVDSKWRGRNTNHRCTRVHDDGLAYTHRTLRVRATS